MSRALVAWAPAIVYAGMIVAMSSIPSESLPSGEVWSYDKVIHLCEYAVLAALLVRALSLGPPGLACGAAFGVAVAVAIAFGVSDEWHQSFTPGRDSSLGDVLADAAGSAIGAAAAIGYRVQRRRARHSQ